MRWQVKITYLTDNGPLDIDHQVEEIEDVHDIVERGPNFYSIQNIVIEPIPLKGSTGKTIETLEAE